MPIVPLQTVDRCRIEVVMCHPSVKDFTSSREELRTALESPGLMNETAPVDPRGLRAVAAN
jgi:hypothetical protein